MKPKIYVFSGFSGAGKDTAASVFIADNVKFANPGKRALEFIYHLPDGFMDDRIARQQIAPFSDGKTYLEVLIEFWKHRDLLVGDQLFGEQTKTEILGCLESGRDVTVTDMRNRNELAVLFDLCELGYEIVPVWIYGGTKLESDVYQDELYRRLCAFVGTTGNNITNDFPTVEQFKEQVREDLFWLEPRSIQASPVEKASLVS